MPSARVRRKSCIIASTRSKIRSTAPPNRTSCSFNVSSVAIHACQSLRLSSSLSTRLTHPVESASAITTIGVEATTSIASTTTTSELSASASTSAVTSAVTIDPSRLPSQNPIITSSAAQSPTNSPTNQPDAESDRGVTIGAAVGASIGGLALGASGVWLFFFLRRRRRAREQVVGDRAPSYAPSYAPQYQSPPPHQVYEAPVEWKPPVSQNQHFSPQELPAWEHNRR